MKFEPLKQMPDVILITPDVYADNRGRFMETFRTRDLMNALPQTGAPIEFVQGNVSMSLPWTMRGLHYQKPDPQGKLVHCTAGSIFDVAVDLRRSSPRFGKWAGVMLDATTHQAVWVPPGFAHGFLTHAHGATVCYECSSYYEDKAAGAIRWDDPDLCIQWPMKIGETPIMSNKDRAAPLFRDIEPFA